MRKTFKIAVRRPAFKAIFLLTFFLLHALLTSPLYGAAVDYDLLYDRGVYITEGGLELPYRLYLPENCETESYPLILSLHGSGYRGTDNVLPVTDGLPLSLVSGGLVSVYKAIVVAPQCPEDMQWVDVPWETGCYSIDEVPESEVLRAAFELTLSLCAKHNADPARLYVTGLSMGGYGTWDLLARHPGVFAAAIPICGGGDPDSAERMSDVAVRSFHGDSDLVVPYSGSLAMNEALLSHGCDAALITYEGGGHNAWGRTYRETVVYDWLFSQRRKDTSKTQELVAEYMNAAKPSDTFVKLKNPANFLSEPKAAKLRRTGSVGIAEKQTHPRGLAAAIGAAAMGIVAAAVYIFNIFRAKTV